MKDLETVCKHLDKLTMDSLTLMEELVECKLGLEDAMRDGESHLVKSRYILGQNSVSRIQLPTEDGEEFVASAVVNSNREDLGYTTYDVEFATDRDNVKDPLRWFGVLVPRDMHAAQKRYKEALSWVSRVADVQSKLDYNIRKMDELRCVKRDLMSGGEE